MTKPNKRLLNSTISPIATIIGQVLNAEGVGGWMGRRLRRGVLRDEAELP